MASTTDITHQPDTSSPQYAATRKTFFLDCSSDQQTRRLASRGGPAILEEHVVRDMTHDGSLIASVQQGLLF